MSQTAEYIKKLSDLQEGERAQLRRLAGQSLDATIQGFDLFTVLWWPLRAKSPSVPRRGPSWLVAKLFGAFRIPHIPPESGAGSSLPEVLGRCEPNDEDGSRQFRARFDALLCSSLLSLEPHLRWALSRVDKAVAGHIPHARDVTGIDWVQLLDDLSIWDRGKENSRGRDIHDIWAEMYLNAIQKKGGH